MAWRATRARVTRMDGAEGTSGNAALAPTEATVTATDDDMPAVRPWATALGVAESGSGTNGGAEHAALRRCEGAAGDDLGYSVRVAAPRGGWRAFRRVAQLDPLRDGSRAISANGEDRQVGGEMEFGRLGRVGRRQSGNT